MNKLLITAFAAATLVATPALAQLNGGLVVIDLSRNNVDLDLLNNVANDLNVNVSQIPVNVQVPIGLAAAICDVNANVLAQQKKNGGSPCTAKNQTSALNKAVQRQMVRQ